MTNQNIELKENLLN